MTNFYLFYAVTCIQIRITSNPSTQIWIPIPTHKLHLDPTKTHGKRDREGGGGGWARFKPDFPPQQRERCRSACLLSPPTPVLFAVVFASHESRTAWDSRNFETVRVPVPYHSIFRFLFHEKGAF